MFDLVQVVLLAVIIIFTVLLVALGIQVFFILKEVRRTVTKTNGILEKADSITESVRSPLSAISSLTSGVQAQSLLTLAKFVKGLLGHDNKTQEKGQDGK